MTRFLLAGVSLAFLIPAQAQLSQQERQVRKEREAELIRNAPRPARADVAYGPHARNVLDFWRAGGRAPAPLVVYIHGGGFVNGDKLRGRAEALLPRFLKAGVNFASISYRLRPEAPIQDILRDAARAIQFLRVRAGEFGIDKSRIGVYGGSAGAGTSLWLAFHDDLADPGNADPVLRESSRVRAAGAIASQFSYDLLQWPAVFGIRLADFYPEDPGFYGLAGNHAIESDAGKRIRAGVDMRGLITRDDPPIFLFSRLTDTPPQSRDHLNHHPRHAKLLRQRLEERGVPVEMYLEVEGPQPPGGLDEAMFAFFRKHLGGW